MIQRLKDAARLLRLSARSLASRYYAAVAALPLLWPAFLYFRLLVGWRVEAYEPAEAQNVLMGVPLAVLGLLLGVRVVAGELDKRTLEIAYTVPGGAHRVWLAKFTAAALILLLSEALLAVVAWIFFTSYPAAALYGAFQAGALYLALGTAFGALFRSEATGALAGFAVLALNGILTGFGGVQLRVSPFWNPVAEALEEFSPSDLLAWTVQNRIGFVLITAAVVGLAVARAERREKMLG